MCVQRILVCLCLASFILTQFSSTFRAFTILMCLSFYLFHKLFSIVFFLILYVVCIDIPFIFVYYVDFLFFSTTTTTTMSITFAWLQIYLASHPFLSGGETYVQYIVSIYICTNVQTKILHWSQFNKKKSRK